MATINSRYFYQRLDALDISLRQLGRRMGLSHSQLSLTFHGKRRMQMDEAVTLSKLFGVTLAEIAHHAGLPIQGVTGSPASVVAVMHGDASVEPHPGVIVAPPFGLPEDVVAIQARTADTPLAWMDGWLMYACPGQDVSPDSVGRFCWVRTADGREYVGTLRHGYEAGTYGLSPPAHVDDLTLVWARPILLTQHAN